LATQEQREQTRFRVDVTQEDIDRAVKNASTKCVVAQAIARTIPDATRIEVDIQAIRFTRAESGNRYLYLTPPAVGGYVVAFDAGDEIDAFRFTLTNPQRIARRIRTEAGQAADNARAAAKRKPRKEPVAPLADGATEARAAVVEPELVSPEEQAAIAKEAYIAAKEDYAGEPLTKSDNGGRWKNPRTYKTGKRVYGSRILRVNRYLVEQD